MKIKEELKRAARIFQEEGPIALTKKSFARIKTDAIIMAMMTFRAGSPDHYSSPGELVHFAYSGYWGAIRPGQVYSEISGLIKILMKDKPKYVLEIGTANGGTLFLFSKLAHENAVIISIDLPGYGRFGSGYPLWKKQFYEGFASQKQKMHLLRADSHSELTRNAVRSILRRRQLDFLFIDGDHTYKGVRKDFEMYAPMVRRGGIIALHDIVAHPAYLDCGVDKFWEEIKSDYKHFEIIGDRSQKWAGIGVIRK